MILKTNVTEGEACHAMAEGEVLNAADAHYPLHEALIYGDRTLAAKLSKRVSCSIKSLPLRVRFTYEYDTLKALEAGITHDPTLVLDGQIFIEGLMQAEAIAEQFLSLLPSE